MAGYQGERDQTPSTSSAAVFGAILTQQAFAVASAQNINSKVASTIAIHRVGVIANRSLAIGSPKSTPIRFQLASSVSERGARLEPIQSTSRPSGYIVVVAAAGPKQEI